MTKLSAAKVVRNRVQLYLERWKEVNPDIDIEYILDNIFEGINMEGEN